MSALEGIAAADALIGRAFPLPAAALPLARWVDVTALGDGAEVAWNLDDSRPGAPGRLALYAGPGPPPERDALAAALSSPAQVVALPAVLRSAPLDEAQASLRPVLELAWEAGGLHLRLTGQGPWSVDALLEIAATIVPSGADH